LKSAREGGRRGYLFVYGPNNTLLARRGGEGAHVSVIFLATKLDLPGINYPNVPFHFLISHRHYIIEQLMKKTRID